MRKESFLKRVEIHPTLKCIRLEKEIMKVIFTVTATQSFANHGTLEVFFSDLSDPSEIQCSIRPVSASIQVSNLSSHVFHDCRDKVLLAFPI